MPRVNLRVYLDPGRVEGFIGILRTDGFYEKIAAVIDTGAQVPLLPADLREELDHRFIQRVTVIQAGIARQAFDAVEAVVTLFFEDEIGARTGDTAVRVWFADSDVALIGFDGLLDRATLNVDMRERREAWLELDS